MRRLPFLVALLLCAPGALRGQSACSTLWRLEEILRIGSFESTDLVASVLDLAIGPDSALYVAMPPTFDLLVISIRGDTLLRRSIEYEPREVTRAMERRLEDEYAGWRAGDYYPSGLQITETTLERRRRAARRVFWVPEYPSAGPAGRGRNGRNLLVASRDA